MSVIGTMDGKFICAVDEYILSYKQVYFNDFSIEIPEKKKKTSIYISTKGIMNPEKNVFFKISFYEKETIFKEDIKFNHEMVNRARSAKYSEQHCKVAVCNCIIKKIQPKIPMFEKRDYDFSSEILEHFRKKWGISDKVE